MREGKQLPAPWYTLDADEMPKNKTMMDSQPASRSSISPAVLLAVAAGLILLGFFAGALCQKLKGTSELGWSTYQNPAFRFSFRYPSFFRQIEEGTSSLIFSTGKEESRRFQVSIEGAAASSTTEEWLKSQPQGNEVQEGYQLIAAFESDGMRLVARYEIVDHDNQGRPVFEKILEGIEVKNRQVFKVTYPNRTSVDQLPVLNGEMAAVIGSFVVEDSSESSPADINQAKAALTSFLSKLYERNYSAVARDYGSDYDTLREWNPTLDPNDFAALWQRGCEENGLRCLEMREVALSDHSRGGTYVFSVRFSNPDGSEFSRGPCCGGSEEPPQTSFPFTVTKSLRGEFKVQTMPVYTP